MQEVIVMRVLGNFCVVYMKQPLTQDFTYVSVCPAAAARFMFHSIGTAH